jgi:hypothetical protein
MSESTSAFPLDSSIWEHIKHMNYSVGIQVSDTRVLDILNALHDIYETINESPEDAQELLIGLAAILTAVKDDKANVVFEEFMVKDTMQNFDKGIERILNEKPN